MLPSSSACAMSTPLRLMKRTVPGVPRSRRSAWAVAKVAWPHRLVSTTGVNQRSAQSASPLFGQRVGERGLRKVHLRGDLPHPGLVGPSVGPSSRHTAAGLPAKGRSVKASMMRIRMPGL